MKPSLVAASLALIACGPATPNQPQSPAELSQDSAEPQDAEAQIAAIASAVNHYAPEVHACWDAAAADDFRLDGTLVLRIEMGELRSARSVEVVGDEPGDPVLRECMTRLWQSVVWPRDVFASGDVIQLPPFQFVAPEAQYTVPAAAVPVRSLAGTAIDAQVLLDAAATGNPAAALSRLTLRDGASVPLHRHDAAEILYVVSGQGALTDLRNFPPRVDRRQAAVFSPVELGPGDAIYVPAGVAHGFSHRGSEPVVLVQLYAPAGPEQRFEDPAHTAGTTAVPASELGDYQRKLPPAPRVSHHRSTRELSIAGGKAGVRILFDARLAGDPAAYVGVFRAAPGAAIPAHQHDRETELLYVLEGEGVLTVAGRDIALVPGTAVQVPPGTEHSGAIGGDGDLRAVQFYTPSGPEQRFKEEQP